MRGLVAAAAHVQGGGGGRDVTRAALKVLRSKAKRTIWDLRRGANGAFVFHGACGWLRWRAEVASARMRSAAARGVRGQACFFLKKCGSGPVTDSPLLLTNTAVFCT